MHIQFKTSVAHALDLLYMVSNLFEHAPNLAILAFGQCNFVPGIVGFANQIDSGGRSFDSPSVFRADK